MLESTISKNVFLGDGTATAFPFNFRVWDTSQLLVVLTSPAGETSTATGWTAELTESGGTLTYPHNGAPLPEGWKLAIVRNMPFVQEVDLITGTRFDPEVVETALDVATAERQQLLERLGRAVVVEPTDEAGPEALLADIKDARSTATAAASSAQANANAAANSAQSAAGSAGIATEEREAACICAQEAQAARDAAVQQTEAANTLMEAELAKVNAIVAANRTDQQAAVTAARQWAEKAPDTPVDYDADGNPRYSARHWAENAQKIAIEPPTAERRGSIRVGAGLELTTGENGETDVLGVSPGLGGHLLLNSEEWITESGEWVAPVTGWYDILMFDGGSSGSSSKDSVSTAKGGGSGRWKHTIKYLTAMQEVLVTIGAGGVPTKNSNGYAPGSGGYTSFGDITTDLTSFNGFSSNYSIQISLSNAFALYGNGAGFGGGSAVYANITTDRPQDAVNAAANAYGHFGGGGGSGVTSTGVAAGKGAPGSVRVRWHDPAKANGPAPAPALFTARRMVSRAAAAPVTVNLYDPETGQGSVWREEDAEAQLAKGLITEEAWLDICVAKAAEERAAWLADPETEAERFAMLRAARDVKLAEHDVHVVQLQRQARAGADVADDLAAWDAYAVALCDLPAQEGAPWDGGGELTPWPEMPAVSKAQEA